MQMDLTNSSWTLIGWLPNTWVWMGQRQDLDLRRHQCTPEIPAQLPGSVQDDLLRAGLILDWNVGLNSLQCEWGSIAIGSTAARYSYRRIGRANGSSCTLKGWIIAAMCWWMDRR